MKCPYCRNPSNDVYNTRRTRFDTQIWRRRRCLSCGESFTTYEQPDLGFLRVNSSGGKPERYSRAKLFSEIYDVFQGVAVSPQTIDAVTDTIEGKILDLAQDVVSPNQIAAITLTTLKHFNTPAFLRYLSVHAELRSNAELKRQLKQY